MMTNVRCNRLFILLLLVIVFMYCENVKAEESKTASVASLDTTGGESPKILKGNVEIVQLELQTLEDIGPYIKNILKTASTFYDEVTIQPVQVITQPNIVYGGTITNIPVGTQPTGPPPVVTDQQINAAIRKMKPPINQLKKNVDQFMSGEKQLNLPNNLLAQLDPQFTEWIGLVNRISAQEIELERIAQNPPYDNFEVAKSLLIIQKCAKRLDKVRLSIYKVMRKESKIIAAHRNSND